MDTTAVLGDVVAWNSSGQDRKDAGAGGCQAVGLVNGDNRCYINAVMQCLFHCRCFVREAKRLLPFIDEDFPKEHKHLLEDYRNVYETKTESKLIGIPHFFEHNGSQQDAQELLGCFTHAYIKSPLTKIESPLSKLWAFKDEVKYRCPVPTCQQWQYELTCVGEPNPKPLGLLQLDVQRDYYEHGRKFTERFTDLQRCVDHYLSEERTPADTVFQCGHCEDCGSLPFKKTSLAELPELLLINLKSFAYIGSTKMKLPHRVTFPDELPLDGKLYKLRGVVYHGGGAYGGHYWAFVSTSNGSWTLCNDNAVRPAIQAEPWQSFMES